MSRLDATPATASFLAAALCLLASAAAAHPYFVGPAMMPGQRFQGELQITHNCFGKPTVEVVLRLPAGTTGIEALSTGSWHARLDGKTTDIIWQGGPEEGQLRLPFAFKVPQWPAGKPVFFPVVQRCAAGEVHRWVEIPAAGQSHDDLGFPAAMAVIGQKLELPEGEMDDHMQHMHEAAAVPVHDAH